MTSMIIFDNRIFYQWYDWRGCLTNHIFLCISDMHAVDCQTVVFKSHINASFSCRVIQDQKSKRVFFKAFYESAIEQKIQVKESCFLQIPEWQRVLGQVSDLNNKDYVEIAYLTTFGTFRSNRDQDMDFETRGDSHIVFPAFYSD